MTKENIKNIIRENREVLEKYSVKYIALFGSYARDEQEAGSDADFLIEFEKPTFRNYMGFLSEMKRLLNGNVDIVCKDALHKRIAPYILKEAEELI